MDRGKNKKKTNVKNRRNPHQSEVGRNQKDPTQKLAKGTLINDYIKEPILKEIILSKAQKRNPVTRIEDIFMNYEVATDKVIDTTVSHNTGSKLLDNVTFNNSHTTWINPYPTAFPYGNGIVLHFYQQQESSTTKTVHKVINTGLKAYV